MSLIKINNKLIKLNNKLVGLSSVDPYNPLNLPPFTIRLKYKQGTTPTFSNGTGVLVDAGENIWDLTYEPWEGRWVEVLYGHSDLLEVLGANSTGVTNMDWMFRDCVSLTSVSLFDTSSVLSMSNMFRGCRTLTTVPLFDTSKVRYMDAMLEGTSLTTVPLFDTSNVFDMSIMFAGCISLTNIPLFNTSNVESMFSMFNSCYSVQSGALALYLQASTQPTPPTEYSNAFLDCGSNTQTGRAELAQIPTSWGGTMQE